MVVGVHTGRLQEEGRALPGCPGPGWAGLMCIVPNSVCVHCCSALRLTPRFNGRKRLAKGPIQLKTVLGKRA